MVDQYNGLSMTSDSGNSGRKVRRSPVRGLGAWLAPVAVVVVIAALLLPRWLSLGRSKPEDRSMLMHLDRLPIRVSPELKPGGDVVPAERGALAGSNLLLITLDTTRAEQIGCYGNPNIETPVLDRLAAEGVLFSRVMAVAPTTLPAHSSLLTGLYPLHHGARANGLFRLNDECVTLAELLGGQGYTTGGFVSAWVLAERFGIGAGFAEFNDGVTEGDIDPTAPADAPGVPQRSADQTNQRAFRWLRTHANERFFLWVHYYDPHMPWTPPSPYTERYAHLYEGEIAYTDSEVGNLLKVLEEVGRTEDTLVVVVGDHGEGVGNHKEWSHAYLLYESTQHVPLIMRCGRRLGGGVHVDRLISQVDIMPTILALLGLESPPGIDGQDLTRPPSGARRLFAETCGIEAGVASLRAVRNGRLKYIHGPIPELFDLSVDPFELHNLADSREQTVREFEGMLREFFGNELEEVSDPTVTLSAEEQSKLAALGYVPMASGSPEGPLPDPKDMIEVLGQINLANMSPPEERIPQLEETIRVHPGLGMVYFHLAQAHMAVNDQASALEALSRGLEVAPNSPPMLAAFASIKAQQNEPETAMEYYRRLLEVAPARLEGLAGLGVLLGQQGRLDEAAEMLTRAFELAPENDSVRANLVVALTAVGQVDQAMRLLDEAVRANPDLDAVRDHLLKLYQQEQRYAEAVAMLRRGLQARPQKLDLANNLAAVLSACPDAAVRDPSQAVDIAKWLCERNGHRDARYLFTLSVAHLAAGQVEEAISVGNRAYQTALDQGLSKLAETIRKRVQSFKDAGDAGASIFPDS